MVVVIIVVAVNVPAIRTEHKSSISSSQKVASNTSYSKSSSKNRSSIASPSVYQQLLSLPSYYFFLMHLHPLFTMELSQLRLPFALSCVQVCTRLFNQHHIRLVYDCTPLPRTGVTRVCIFTRVIHSKVFNNDLFIFSVLLRQVSTF